MIILFLKGGIGNQLFQIFTVISLSIDTNIKYYINSKFYKSQNKNKVSIRYMYFNTLFKEIENNICYNKILYNNYYNDFRKGKEYIDLTKYKNIILNSYYENPLYFNHNKDNIVKLLKFDEQLKNLPNPVSNSVALHFRFGDKYKFGYSRLSNDYYINAINYLMSNVSKELTFYIFYEKNIEDIPILNNYMDTIKKLNCNIIDTSELNLSDDNELLFMSKFEYYILAESTYSWWGQYLSNNKKLVIAPNNIFYNDNNINNINNINNNENTNKILIPFINVILI